MISSSKLAFILSLIAGASAFTAPLNNNAVAASRIQSQSTQLHLFGNAMKSAFSNDDSLGKKQNAGLKNGPAVNEITVNGKPVKAVANQKVSQVLAASRVKMTYSCKKGNCGTCELLINGRIEKACLAKIPKGKCAIQTL